MKKTCNHLTGNRQLVKWVSIDVQSCWVYNRDMGECFIVCYVTLLTIL